MSVAKDVGVSSWDTEVIGHDGPVVVDFWAPWCGPCRMVGPEIDKLSQRMTDVKFVKVNIDEERDLAVKYGVMSIPTVMKFVGGEPAAQVVGARGADALSRELGLA